MVRTARANVAILATLLSLTLDVAYGLVDLKFGSILPLSYAGLADLSADIQLALDLALSDYNTRVFNPLNVNVSIVYADSQFTPAVAKSYARQFASQGLLGVIGEMGSGVTQPIALELADREILQCSGSATSEDLSLKQYRYFFRTIPPDSVQGFVLGQIVDTFGWKKLGLIYQDTAYGKGIMTNLRAHAAATDITVLTNQPYVNADDYEDAVKALKASDARIIVWTGVYAELVDIVPIARRHGLFGPNYVWIATENAISAIDAIRSRIATGASSADDLASLSGLLISTPVEGQGSRFDNFSASYSSTYHNSMGQYSAFFVDCLSIMLDGLTKYQNTSNSTWNDIAQGKFPRDLTVLLKPVDGLTGLTGPIHFNTNFDRIGSYKVLNFHQGDLTKIGETVDETYNVQRNNNTVIFASGTPVVPADRPVLVPDWFEYGHAVSVIIMILYGAMMAINFASLVIVFLWRRRKEVKALSPEFMIIMGLGMQLSYGAVFTLIGEQTTVKCMARPWLYGISFAIVMGCLIGKAFRIWKVFANERLAAPIRFLQILRLAGAFSIGESIILLVWSIYSPLSPLMVANKEKGTFTYVCVSPEQSDVFNGVIFGYNGLLLLAATYLAAVTRNVPSRYSESKFIALTVYSLLIWCTLIIVVSYSAGAATTLVFFIITFGVLFVTTTTWALLIGRVILSQLTNDPADEIASLPSTPKLMRQNAVGAGEAFKSASQLPMSANSSTKIPSPLASQMLRGDISEFPVKITSSWISRWERYELIFTLVPVARLALRPVASDKEGGRSYCVDISKVQATKANVKGVKNCFEIVAPGITLLVQATSEEQVQDWLRRMKQAGCLRGEDSTGRTSSAPGQGGGSINRADVETKGGKDISSADVLGK
ncbi:uncharacterized protein SPPG_03057 [Spizellomyces punctatus DAOM BR117]|uniref:G-protein coupled receptors family 3 profile domain-containing protein n=1 Tax=Spizellomyces punctatus (strain DAOM BR117) TaxID=645134 RepID=A0A0L0HP86_SPIPD|nr:uncharacterized protein SPPG_03057 [Spizellomyces punctatus DAOM BR117]KND02604.1 hypothetical protein SPPG_03057 [Spizellomyces punctatus DAOM BR117]|eukprot:XP_016610643.1 hypothetical protein SPPG_03057 [Spizellomyces punctatus DAOM BR117]